MIEKISDTRSDAGVALLSNGFAGATRDDIQGHPFIYNPVSDKVTSLEHLLPSPRRQQIHTSLRTVDSFCEYLKRFKNAESSIYVTGEKGRYTLTGRIDHSGADKLVWLDHEAQLTILPSESLERWIGFNKTGLSQEAFANLLEERAKDIVDPPAAEILEMANTLHVTRNLSVKSLRRGSSASNSIEYNQEQKLRTGDGSLELPTSFTIKIDPFRGIRNQTTIKVLLRPRIIDDKPSFSYELQFVDENIEDALEEITRGISTQTSLPVYR